VKVNTQQKDIVSNDVFDIFVFDLFLKQKRRQPLAELLVDLLLAAIIYSVISGAVLVSWLIFSFLLHIGYFLLPKWVMRQENLSAADKLRIISRYSVLNGVTVALPLLLFPRLSGAEQAQLSMVYVALSVGVLATNATYRPIFLRYSLSFLIPLPLLWAICDPPDGTWLNEIITVTLIMFLFVMNAMSKDMNRILKESFTIRQERMELNQRLKSALDSAEAANRAKTRFLASASHDLRQPIQTLSLFAAALALRPLDERSRQIANNMNTALHDLTTELDALLDVSKLDAGVVQIQSSNIQLRPFLERIHELFVNTAQEKQLNFTVSCPDDAWIVSDRIHLERVLRNLAENAIKYTDAGSVSIVVYQQHDLYQLSITDTGCGIAESDQARIFEEFFQVSNPERDRKRGLGLGLSIVKRLTEILQIKLQLTSTPQSGTSVALFLPLATAASHALSPPLEQSQQLDGLHILVIDDEESVCIGMKALLEELNCTVSLGASTADAVAAVQIRAPDLLLTDFRLRSTDSGLTTIHTVRKIVSDLPALIITGDPASERLLEAQAAGIPVIHKPVASEVLTQEIRKLVKC